MKKLGTMGARDSIKIPNPMLSKHRSEQSEHLLFLHKMGSKMQATDSSQESEHASSVDSKDDYKSTPRVERLDSGIVISPKSKTKKMTTNFIYDLYEILDKRAAREGTTITLDELKSYAAKAQLPDVMLLKGKVVKNYHFNFLQIDNKITFEQLKMRVIDQSDGISKLSKTDHTPKPRTNRIGCLDDVKERFGDFLANTEEFMHYTLLVNEAAKRHTTSEDRRLRKISWNMPRK